MDKHYQMMQEKKMKEQKLKELENQSKVKKDERESQRNQMREDLKKRRQEAAKNKAKDPEFTIAGVTPELEKMASGDYNPPLNDPLKAEAQKFARKGWGVHVEDQK